MLPGVLRFYLAGFHDVIHRADMQYFRNTVFLPTIAPQSGFKSGHVSHLPFTTQLLLSKHFHGHLYGTFRSLVIFTEGKQQTQPLPVSASHWETNLKHRENSTSIGTKQLRLDMGALVYTDLGNLRNTHLKTSKKWKC